MTLRYIFFLFLFLQNIVLAQNKTQKKWVDSIFNAMTFDEKLGQLFMIRAHSNKDAAYEEMVAQQIRDYKVGGVCFFQGTPEKEAALTNYYQSLTSKVPLFVSMDAEHGLGMRLMESTISYPRYLALGAIQDNHLIYELGAAVGKQCRRLGVNVNFAPDADINNNGQNPVIGMRSFGENRKNVTAKAFAFMQGMQDNDVMACAKHFPGHGDTNTDSHFDLPQIYHSRSRLDSVELMPFRALSQHGIQSAMIAHLNVPSLDATSNLPTTLSRVVVTDLLRKDIGFQGLIFTDAMEMKGVVKYYANGEAEARAIAAGNDIILLPENIDLAFAKIKTYLVEKKIDTLQIYESVKRILNAKYKLKLTNNKDSVSEKMLSFDLNNPEAISLKRRLIANALTTVRNQDNLIPVHDMDDMVTLSIGKGEMTPFQTSLDQFGNMEHFFLNKNAPDSVAKKMIDLLGQRKLVILSLHDLSTRPKNNYGVTQQMIDVATNLAARTKVILTIFGTPYILKYFDFNECVLEAYEEDPMYQEIAANAIMGGSGTNGRLPVTATLKSKGGTGVTTHSLGRLSVDIPERVDMNSEKLKQIDVICNELISKGAAPGCVVLVAKNSKVIYKKAFGYHTYEKNTPMTTEDVFDLASVTKISASTMSLMKLQGEGKIDMKQPMSKYLADLKGSNKESLLLEDIYVHQAGLQAWLKFYEATLDKTASTPRPSIQYYRTQFSADFPIPVAANLFLKKGYEEEIYKEIIKTDLRPTREYKYSDLGLILTTKMIKSLTGKDLDEYTRENFYRPLGLKTTGYKPWVKIPLNRIPPTEEDNYYRNGRVQGYVHDMAAAMLGGVSGHAGLFSNASDLAVLYQMVLNGGTYAGKQYLKPEVIREFTTRHGGSTRRGIGFDMKELDATKTQTVAASASELTFGHTGFTGICVWVDPKYKLIYIFLSNRTYPTMENNKLGNLDYRTKIHQAIYDAMK
jgi:beta-glucosidase-like glycosyl hydrolase/CubicO group peptidase (beta-lactamase class C family)